MKHCMPKYSIVWTADNYRGAIHLHFFQLALWSRVFTCFGGRLQQQYMLQDTKHNCSKNYKKSANLKNYLKFKFFREIKFTKKFVALFFPFQVHCVNTTTTYYYQQKYYSLYNTDLVSSPKALQKCHLDFWRLDISRQIHSLQSDLCNQ